MPNGQECAAAFSAQLDGLADDFVRLEALIGDLVEQDRGVPKSLLIDLQMLDRMRQALQDLATIAAASSIRIDQPARLKEQLLMLQSAAVFGPESVDSSTQSGELDLL